MSAKRGVSVISLLAVLAMLFAFPLTAFAAGPAAVKPVVEDGEEECEPVGIYSYDRITFDNGMGGLWATDYISSTVTICSLGDGYYRVVFVDGGTFITLDADSPGGSGHVAAGITGTIAGGVSIIVSGDLKEYIPSHTGPIDFRGSPPGWFKYLTPFFESGRIIEWEYWYWVYASCGNGVWVDNEETEDAYSDEGPNDLMGDVVGEPVACAKPPMKQVFDGVWAYANPGYTAPVGYLGTVGLRDVCFMISTQGQPSLERLAKTCDNRWIGGPRPGWSAGAVLLNPGNTAVYDDGTAWGVWEGDAIVKAFNPNVTRLPLRAMPGYWSYLFKEFCHYTSQIGEPQGFCK